MAEMLGQFKRLLAQIVEDPDAAITRYTLVTPASEKFLRGPKSDLGAKWEGSVHTLSSEQARRHPNKAAVIDKDGAWTYAELESRSNRLANYLRAGGVQTEDVVAIYADR